MGIERAAIRFEPHPELIKQLKHFEASVSPAGNQILQAGSGYHDDLVVALALAYASMHQTYKAGLLLGGKRVFARQARRLTFDDLAFGQSGGG